MGLEAIQPKVEHLNRQTSKLEGDMGDIKDRVTRVEAKVDNQGEKLDDIHKWAVWFFKTVVGTIIVGMLGALLTLLSKGLV